MTQLRAEIISIGDEMTSGVRLDNNSQWISKKLGDLGVLVAFHTTVGDDMADNVQVFHAATQRANIVIATGGLGPTADDLTRHVISQTANVELVQDDKVLQHIEQMYQSRGREMPPNNKVQSLFPAGSTIIANPEGTAPGIDMPMPTSRIFALPGVPVEMKQMWEAAVEPEIRKQTGNNFVIHHHTIHCFGSGESHIETLLPDLVKRGRDPQVGITASSATISLRVTTRDETKKKCLEKMQPTIDTIHDCLGVLVYGKNGEQLECTIVDSLKRAQKKVAIFDAGLNGAVAAMITKRDHEKRVFSGAEVATSIPQIASPDDQSNLIALALETAKSKGADFGLAIGAIDRTKELVDAGESFYSVAIASQQGSTEKTFRFSGHSGWREIRAVKEVLNFFRLHLIELGN